MGGEGGRVAGAPTVQECETGLLVQAECPRRNGRLNNEWELCLARLANISPRGFPSVAMSDIPYSHEYLGEGA